MYTIFLIIIHVIVKVHIILENLCTHVCLLLKFYIHAIELDKINISHRLIQKRKKLFFKKKIAS